MGSFELDQGRADWIWQLELYMPREALSVGTVTVDRSRVAKLKVFGNEMNEGMTRK